MKYNYNGKLKYKKIIDYLELWKKLKYRLNLNIDLT